MGLSTFNGMPVLVSPYAEQKHREQIRFPRSKRRRIQKKWSKRDENFKTWSEPLAFLVNGTLICHPDILDQFRKEARNQTLIYLGGRGHERHRSTGDEGGG